MARFDLGPLGDIPEGVPHRADAGGTAVLLIREDEDVRAFAHACPHLGLPLSKGVLRGGVLICAFHHACFDARTGAQAEPPGHGDLRRYEVAVEGGRVAVEVPEGADPHPAPAFRRQRLDPRRAVIVGAGAAADACALALRERGFEGAVEMVAPEGEPPYDRTMLSKPVLAGGDPPRPLTITTRDALRARDVALVEGRVARVEQGRVTLASGAIRPWDRLLLAPGGHARRLGLRGEGARGVFTLRSLAQARALAEAATTAHRAVIVGAGFIGLEGALSLAKRGLEVTVVAPAEVPLARVVGERAGRAIRAEHEAAGVRFVQGKAARFEGDPFAALALEDGRAVEGDLCVVAVGIAPATGAIRGLRTDEDGGVSTGADLSVPGLAGAYVAGDCARAPSPWGRVRVEHWRVARQQGARAAAAMLGARPEGVDVPFFWTALGRQYRYVGHAEGWDEVSYDGDPEGGPFVARYVKDGRVMALFGAGRDADLARAHLEMREAGGPLAA